MFHSRPRVLKIIFTTATIILVLFFCLAWRLYSGSLTQAKIKVFQNLSLPMALVNWRAVAMKDFLSRYAVAQIVLGQKDPGSIKDAVVRQMIFEAEVAQLAGQRDIAVDQKQINDQYTILAGQTNLQGQPDFKKFLQTQGLNENQVKNNIIKPQLLLNQLNIWFNSQADLNPGAYELANNLLAQINNGDSMQNLAYKYTNDPAGKNSQGDIGFAQITDLSPELRESVSSLKPGQAKLIPGLKGLFIVRLKGQSGNFLHLQEIFLNTADFNAWLNSQLGNFKVINLLKI